jgi:NAD(P)H-flavin reductase
MWPALWNENRSMNKPTVELDPHRGVTGRMDPWKAWAVSIVRMQVETPGVFSYDLEFADANPAQHYQFLPGQFNMLYVPGVGEAAISIAGQSDGQGPLRHTIRSVGSVTRTMEQAGVGMHLGLRGPFGTSWPLELMRTPADPRDIIIVAGGIGLAPLRSLIMYLAKHRQDFGRVSILLGARTPEDVLYRSEHQDWVEQGIEVHVTVDRATGDWKGSVGVVTLLLERLWIPRPSTTLVMTCGPEVMMSYVARSAVLRDIPEQNVWLTMERNMNCAIGLCGHCQLGPQFICKNGPVFRFDAISPWLKVQDF